MRKLKAWYDDLWRPTLAMLVRIGSAALAALVLLFILVRAGSAYLQPAPAGFVVPAAPLVPTDTPLPIPTATPVPPPPPTPTPVPPTQLVFDQARGQSQHDHDPTDYFLFLSFHTSPAMPGSDVNFGITACNVAVMSSVDTRLDAHGAQTYTTPFQTSCAEPFTVTVTPNFLHPDSGAGGLQPLTGSVSFTVSG